MRHSYLTLAVAMFGLSACAGLTGPVIMSGDAAGIYFTKPEPPPPPDLAGQMPPHQSWCYETAGYAECYSHPQNVIADRLINVDPPSAYPLDPDAYRAALNSKPAIATLPAPAPAAAPLAEVAPAPQPPAARSDLQFEKTNLSDELNNGPTTGVAEGQDAPIDVPVAASPQPLIEQPMEPPAAPESHGWFSDIF